MIGAHDAELIAALAGDELALVQLVRTHQTRLLRFGVRVCGNDSDAQDAVQEALVTLSRRPSMHHDPGVLSWMFSIVRNWCLRILRRSRLRAARHSELEHDGAHDCPEAILEQYRIAECVRSALASLEPSYKDVVVLRDLEGRHADEVCAALALSQAAMKSRLHRGRAALRRALSEQIELQMRANARPKTNFK